MMSRVHKFGFAAALAAWHLASYAAPSKATNAAPQPQEKVQSTFTVPRTPDDGHDPFFPKATSLYQIDAPAKTIIGPGINLLKLNGILGSSLAQVNNKTLSIGETADIKTTSGNLSVRLVEIHGAEGSVVVEANGQRRVLTFSTK